MATSSPEPPQNGTPAPPRRGRPEPLRRVIDRRRIDRVWLPAYVMDEFGAALKPNGLAVYLCLCQHATRATLACNPRIGVMAAEIGASRSTVERSLRLLRSLSLIEVEPTVTARGQKENVYILVDPPDRRDPPRALGTPAGGAVPPTAPPCPIEGGAPSQGRGGAVPLTAPSVEPEYLNQGVRPAPPPHDSCAPREEGARDPVEAVEALWLCLLVSRSLRIRREHQAEIRAEAAELLRRGWTAAQLIESIQAPERLRSEWPREWRARLPARPPRAAKTPPGGVGAAPRPHCAAPDLAEVEKANAELLAAGGLAALAARIGKKVPAAAAPKK